MKRLEGKTALVTGSGRNIGRAIILKLAAEGANVVVNARRNKEEAESVAAEARALGVQALPYIADVSDHKQVNSMFAAAAEQFGGVDILVSNAAIRPKNRSRNSRWRTGNMSEAWCWTGHSTASTLPCRTWKRTNMAELSSSLETVLLWAQPPAPTCPLPRWASSDWPGD